MIRLASIGVLALALMIGAKHISLYPTSDFATWETDFAWFLPECSVSSDSRIWLPVLGKSDQRLSTTRDCGATVVYFDLARYHRQTKDKEAVSSTNSIVDRSSMYRFEPRAEDLFNGRTQAKVTYQPLANRKMLQAWSLYVVGGVATSSPNRAKFLEGLNAITLRPQETGILVVAAVGGEEQTQNELLRTALSSAVEWYTDELSSR